MAKNPINSLNAGEISPYLYGRNDLNKYHNGCLAMENFIPLPYGGAIRRPAVKFLGEVKDSDGDGHSDQSRIIPFISSVANSFQIELGDEYARFWNGDSRINTSEIDIVEAATYVWTASGSGTNEYYLSAIGPVDPTISEPTEIVSTDPSIASFSKSTLGSLKIAQWGFGDNDTLGYNTIYIRIPSGGSPQVKADGYLTANYALEVGTPYSENDLNEIKFAQSVDVMWLVHPSYAVQRISRISNTSWTIEDESFLYPPLLEENDTSITMSPSASTGTITLTSSDNFFDSGHVGAYMKLSSFRLSENQILNETFSASGMGSEFFMSNSNWSISTVGTWTGKIIVERSLDGTTWEDYVFIGDTLGVTASNFSFSSDQPEPFGAKLRTKVIIGTGSVEINIDADNIDFDSLIKITSYTSSTEVTAEVIGDFQDVPSDYTDYSTLSGTITSGTKAVDGSDKITYDSFVKDLTTIDAGLANIVAATYFSFSPKFVFLTSDMKFWVVNSTLTSLIVGSIDISAYANTIYDVTSYSSKIYIACQDGTGFAIKRFLINGTYEATELSSTTQKFSGITYNSTNDKFYINEITDSVPSSIKEYTTSFSYTGNSVTNDSSLFTPLGSSGSIIYRGDASDTEVESYDSSSLDIISSTDVSTEVTGDIVGVTYDGSNLWVAENNGEFFRYNIPEFPVTYYECINSHTYNADINAVIQNWSVRTPAMTTWSEGAFSDYRGHPTSITFHEDRLWYGGTTYRPETLWGSQIDDYSNFRLGSLDDEALKLNLGGQFNPIRWLVSQRQLIIGTSGAEWTLGPSADQTPITPSSYNLKRRSTYGSNVIQGFLANKAILFTMRQSRKVREWIDNNTDLNPAADLTLMSEHITKSNLTSGEGIIQAAFQQQPDNIVWFIRDDGVLLGLTYERDQDVSAWHQHPSGFSYQSLCVVPNESNEDSVYFTVKIGINGYNKQYICRFENQNWGSDIGTDWVGPDLNTVYNSPNSATLYGLHYLEGQTVSILAEDTPKTNATVSDGAITIDASSYARVVVGQSFTATVAPIYLVLDNQYGTSYGNKIGASTAMIHFKDTYSAKVGQTESDLEAVRFDTGESPLHNDLAKVYMSNANEFLQTCYIVQEDQMPCTVLAAIPNMEVI